MVFSVRRLTIRFKSPMYFLSGSTLNWFKILVVLAFSSLAPFVHATLTNQNSYSIFEAKPISDKRILPTTPFENVNEVGKIRIVAARGEYEPASFVIAAHQDVLDLKPNLTTALRSDKEVISASNVDIRLVKRWYQGCLDSIHYTHCPGGSGRFLVPELLLKDDKLVKVDREKKLNLLKVSLSGDQTYIDITSAESSDLKRGDDRNIPSNAKFNDDENLQAVNISKNENQQYWITVYVPPEASPGLYAGKIVLTSSSAPDRDLDIELDVLPFELDPPNLEYSIYYKGRIVGEDVNLQGVKTELKTEKQFTREMENLRRHGIVSTTITQTYSKFDDLYRKNLEIRKSSGMNSKLYILWSGSYFSNMELAKDLMNYVKGFGFNEVYFYGGEELSDEEWAEQAKMWKSMRDIGGKVFVGKSDPAIAENVDLAVGGTRKLTKDEAIERARAYHAFGHRIFARSNPQVGVENSEVYRRNYGMLLLATEYDGTMNYAYQDSWGSVWNDFDGYFRDHIFAYPTTDGLVDTIQWEGFREGIDDVRYLSTLNNLIRDAKSAKVDMEEVDLAKVEEWIHNIDYQNADLDVVRKQIIEKIMGLREILLNLKIPRAPSSLRISELPKSQ